MDNLELCDDERDAVVAIDDATQSQAHSLHIICKLCEVKCTSGVDATEFGCDSCTKIHRDEGGNIRSVQSDGSVTTPTHWDCECDEDWIHEKHITKKCERCGFTHDECPDTHIWDVYDFSNGMCAN